MGVYSNIGSPTMKGDKHVIAISTCTYFDFLGIDIETPLLAICVNCV